MRKRKIILIIFFIIFIFPIKVFSNRKIDSLLYALSISNDTDRIDILTALAWENRVSNPVKTINYGVEALKYAQKFNKEKKYSKIMSFISTGYRNLEDYNKATEYCLKALDFAIKQNDKKEIAYSYHTLSTIYLFQSNYDEALKYLNKSFEIFNELKDIRGLGYCYHSFGNIYTNNKEYDLALEYYNKALQINIDDNNKNGSATLLNEIGELYYKQRNFVEALKYFDKSLQIFLELNLDSKVGKEYANIAKTHLQINNINKAIQYANESLNIGNTLKLDEIVTASTYVLYESYKRLKNFEKALFYQELYVKTKVNFINKKKNRQIYEMQTKYESQSKDLNIKLLEKEKAIHYNIIFLFIVFSVITMFLLFILFRKNRNKKKSNKLLENAKKKLIKHSDELTKLNRRLIESENKLKDSNDSKNKLFSIISHDLINPINSILGFSDVLYKEYDIFDENEIKKYLKLINESTRKLFLLIDNLLQWSRSQLDHIKYSPDFYPVKEIVDNLMLTYFADFKNKNIKVSFDISETNIAYYDKEMIEVVIRNLVSNAIKFTNPGGEIRISAKEKGQYIEVAVSDTGVGISKENIDKLFKDEISYTSTGTLAEKGTGLGLVICRDFVRINKGEIWVESIKGDGSVFKFTLPIFQQD